MLSKTCEYALRVVTFLASIPGEATSAQKLADRTKVPNRYLYKVLQDLVAADLLQSRPGPGGGYELIANRKGITILDVVNAVDPIERIHSCPLGLASHTELCPLHAELDRAYATTEAALAAVTIEKLIQSADSIIPLCDVTE